MADWIRIRNEYITGDMGLRTLAAARGVSFNTMKDKAKREGWSASRAEYRQSLGIAVVTVTPQHHTTDATITRASRVFSAADQLLARIDEMSRNRPDAKEVKLLADALKDVKEIHMIRDELDRQAAELRNRKLEREVAEADSSGKNQLTVGISNMELAE